MASSTQALSRPAARRLETEQPADHCQCEESMAPVDCLAAWPVLARHDATTHAATLTWRPGPLDGASSRRVINQSRIGQGFQARVVPAARFMPSSAEARDAAHDWPPEPTLDMEPWKSLVLSDAKAVDCPSADEGDRPSKRTASDASRFNEKALEEDEEAARLTRKAKSGEVGDEEATAAATTPHDGSLGLRLPSSEAPVSEGRDAFDRASGGCDARTLANLGLFDADEATAKAALNDEIDAVHKAFRRNDPNCARERAGVDDVEWAQEVVTRAVTKFGYHMIRVQKSVAGARELRDVDLKGMIEGGGAFFLDGYLNHQYMRGSKAVSVRVAGSGGNRHRHSTAVVDNKVHDHPAFILNGSMGASNLWLDRRSTPNAKKGYLRGICKAYRVYKCSKKPGSRCNGKCG